MGILRTDRVSGLGGANAITGSTFFGGSGSRLRVNNIDDDFVTWWTADFTIEAWIFVSAIESWYYDDGTYDFPVMVGHMNPSDNTNYWSFGPTENNIIKFYYWKGSQNHTFVSTATVKENEWTHIAMSFSTSNGAKLFVNGTGTSYISLSGTPQVNSSASQFVVGQYLNQNLSGNISNLRMIKGTALYTSDFTPPANRLERTSDTKLLICNSASNVTHNDVATDDERTISVEDDGLSGASNSNNGPIASKFTPNSPVGFSTTTDVGGQYGSTFDGFGNFASSTYMVPPGGNTRERNRGRALYAGGYKTPNTVTTIDSVEIQSGGITEQFGDLSSTTHANCSACSSSTRMVTNGGFGPSANNNIMEFVTIANSSNSTDFGDLAVGRRNNISASNQTRGLVYGGNGSPANTAQVDFFTIATAGNAADFGDASSSTALMPGAGSSTTRALFAGGYTPSASDTIDYFTIASTGNATDFGNLVSARKAVGGLSSSTRTLFGGGGYPSAVNSIDYVTTATTGNAQDFGDLTLARATLSGTSNQTRGIFMGGTTNPARQNTIDFVIIAVTSDAIDFGDLRTEKQNGGVASDSHGGL